MDKIVDKSSSKRESLLQAARSWHWCKRSLLQWSDIKDDDYRRLLHTKDYFYPHNSATCSVNLLIRSILVLKTTPSTFVGTSTNSRNSNKLVYSAFRNFISFHAFQPQLMMSVLVWPCDTSEVSIGAWSDITNFVALCIAVLKSNKDTEHLNSFTKIAFQDLDIET